MYLVHASSFNKIGTNLSFGKYVVFVIFKL